MPKELNDVQTRHWIDEPSDPTRPSNSESHYHYKYFVKFFLCKCYLEESIIVHNAYYKNSQILLTKHLDLLLKVLVLFDLS